MLKSLAARGLSEEAFRDFLSRRVFVRYGSAPQELSRRVGVRNENHPMFYQLERNSFFAAKAPLPQQLLEKFHALVATGLSAEHKAVWQRSFC